LPANRTRMTAPARFQLFGNGILTIGIALMTTVIVIFPIGIAIFPIGNVMIPIVIVTLTIGKMANLGVKTSKIAIFTPFPNGDG
jgi:hypothetical protein